MLPGDSLRGRDGLGAPSSTRLIFLVAVAMAVAGSDVSLGVAWMACVVLLLPGVVGDRCTGYHGNDGVPRSRQDCGMELCCADCNLRHCCVQRDNLFSQESHSCEEDRPRFEKSRLPFVLSSILGSVLPVSSCVTLIICCVAPCCLCYKKCGRGRRRQEGTAMVIQMLPQPGSAPEHLAYQSVPVQPALPGFYPPMAPPPSYLEAVSPASSPPPPPPYWDGTTQPPYNPSYVAGP